MNLQNFDGKETTIEQRKIIYRIAANWYDLPSTQT